MLFPKIEIDCPHCDGKGHTFYVIPFINLSFPWKCNFCKGKKTVWVEEEKMEMNEDGDIEIFFKLADPPSKYEKLMGDDSALMN